MPDYVSFQALAKRLIEGAGRTIELHSRSAAPANTLEPWKGTPLSATGSPVNVTAAIVPPSGSLFGHFYSRTEVALMPENSLVCMVAHTSLPTGFSDPERVTEVVDGGRSYRVLSVMKLAPGPLPILYAYVLVQ